MLATNGRANRQWKCSGASNRAGALKWINPRSRASPSSVGSSAVKVVDRDLPRWLVELLAEAEYYGSDHHDGGDFHDLLLLLAAPTWRRSTCFSDAASGRKVAGVLSATRRAQKCAVSNSWNTPSATEASIRMAAISMSSLLSAPELARRRGMLPKADALQCAYAANGSPAAPSRWSTVRDAARTPPAIQSLTKSSRCRDTVTTCSTSRPIMLRAA